jgi:hypothetical protein
MEAYKLEVERAWNSFLNELRKGVNVRTAIGKVRGSYGDALANTVQDKIAKELLANG